MHLISVLFVPKAALFMVGGVFSLFLAAVLIYCKQNIKHKQEKDSILRNIQLAPELRNYYGDVDEYLKNQHQFRQLFFWEEITINSLRPLYIMAFVNLFSSNTIIAVFFAFAITILSFAHELILADKYRNYWLYRVIIFSGWVFFYLTLLPIS